MVALEDQDVEAGFLRDGGAAGALVARVDWAASRLGPIGSWPQSLRTALAIVLRSPAPMLLLWGEDAVTFYNDAASTLIGRAHPGALGRRAMDVWPEAARLSFETQNAALSGRTLSFRDHVLTTFRSGRVEQAWFDIDCSPVPDEAGRPAGVLIICAETTQRVLAERRAAAELERQRQMFEQAPGFICLLRGPEHLVEFANAAHRRLFGGEAAIGKPYREAFAHLDGLDRPEILDQVYATGVRYVTRAERLLVRNPAGVSEERFIDLVLEPLTDPDGQVTGLFFEGFDVTDQVRAQQAAEESERRLSAAVSIARLGAFEWDLVTQEATLDDRAREIFGFTPDEPLSVGDVVARIDAQDLPRLHDETAAFENAGRTRREFEYRIHLPDGATRHIAAVSDAALSPDGRVARIRGVFDDVTEQRAAERRQRMLINELNHRVKNTLATVQSIASQTLRSAPDLAAARDSFEARLVALAAAHDLLTAQSWHGASVPDVVATAMAPFETVQRPQIRRTGPPVWVNAQSALALSLALHELATNAAKYGALSLPSGQVSVSWSLSGAELVLSWIETGGPPVTAPARSGFGTRLLQRGLAHELNGEVTTTFAPDGVRCEIRCHVDDVRAKPQPEVASV